MTGDRRTGNYNMMGDYRMFWEPVGVSPYSSLEIDPNLLTGAAKVECANFNHWAVGLV